MRVLQIVKTSDGADWAAWQAAELVRLGVEVHAALPSRTGRMIEDWRKSGANLHFMDLDFPARDPWRLFSRMRAARWLIGEVKPDLIHTHFFGPTLVVRLAMRRSGPLRIFQVAGPLHLEHSIYRTADLMTATKDDYWIGSSQYIVSLYRKAGLACERLFTSYHGTRPEAFQTGRSGFLRRILGIPDSHRVVGNINYIYPPKYHAGQFIGVKAHEDIIDALALVVRQRSDVTGVLIGGTWGKSSAYERKLRIRAQTAGEGRIQMPGYFDPAAVRRSWADFDCAIHVPRSENCGGVVEPLSAGVPTIAGRVGGLPEVVMDGLTGKTVPIRKPHILAEAILSVLDNLEESKRLASAGQSLVRTMFDIRRTSPEVHAIYRRLLDGSSPPPPTFDPFAFVQKHCAAGA
jgi:glycosyltransferase involved in cell wall biosynthesis